MDLLKGKIVLVTGGGTGIGKTSASLFAQEGAKVVISGRRKEKGKETETEIQDKGGECLYIQSDVSKKEQVRDLINEIITKYGCLDCAFNNAGIDGKKASIIDLEESEWDEIIDINLKGTFYLMKNEIKQMLKQGHGIIVNMASVNSFLAHPGRCAYNASRHGVLALTKTGAQEYGGKNIRINAVAPGSIKTDIFLRSTGGNPQMEKVYAMGHPLGRIGKPVEVANAVLWLFSDASSFVHGHTLMVDGGLSINTLSNFYKCLNQV